MEWFNGEFPVHTWNCHDSGGDRANGERRDKYLGQIIEDAIATYAHDEDRERDETNAQILSIRLKPEYGCGDPGCCNSGCCDDDRLDQQETKAYKSNDSFT